MNNKSKAGPNCPMCEPDYLSLMKEYCINQFSCECCDLRWCCLTEIVNWDTEKTKKVLDEWKKERDL